MNVPKKYKDRVRNLANRFRRNSPVLCRVHKPEGLPIDAPEGVDISKNHPSYKFERIVEDASSDTELQYEKSQIRMILREEFSKVFYKNCNKIDCIECEDESINAEDIPSKYESIAER